MSTNQDMARELLLNYVRYEYQPELGSEGPEVEVPLHATILFDLCPEDQQALQFRCESLAEKLYQAGEEFEDTDAADVVIKYLTETNYFED